MKLRTYAATVPLATVLVFGIGWSQQQPVGQSTAEAPSKGAKVTAKEKHLNGSLVDIGCMVTTLRQVSKASPQTGAGPGVAHFMGAGVAAAQAGPGQVSPGGPGPGTMQGPMQRNPDTGVPPDNPASTNPDPQQAQLEQAMKVDKAANECVASPQAQNLGLAMSGGQLVQFDQNGNAKAKDALKTVDVEPGKKIKAKVTGTMEDKNTVNVASIEIKGKRGTGKNANPGS